jgi:hypothetical protein
MQFKTVSHMVEANRISSVLPLIIGDKMLSPDAGIILLLADGTKKKWLAEPNAPMPVVGDFLISNQELHVTYVVNPEQFQRLFEAA